MKLFSRFLISFIVLSLVQISYPLLTHASATVGDLIKCPDSSAVYYLAQDGNRYAFPNEAVFYSWYDNFDEVKTIACSDLATLTLTGLVPYQAGTRLVKIPSAPTVYFVDFDATLRAFESEEDVAWLFGSDWNNLVDDLPETFFSHYTLGTAMQSNEIPAGLILKDHQENLYRTQGELSAFDLMQVVSDTSFEEQLNHFALDFSTFEARTSVLITLESSLNEDQKATLTSQLKTVQVQEEDIIDSQEVILFETESFEDETDADASLPEEEITGESITQNAEAELDMVSGSIEDIESLMAVDTELE